MSHCNLGLSCEPIKDDLSCCKHLVHLSLGCELCELHKQIMALTDMYKELSIRVVAQHDFKLRQIDENRKISRRVDEVERFQDITHLQYKNKKSPYKCPVCDGCGNSKGEIELNPNYEFSMKYASCHSCEGKGIVWS